MSMMLRWLAHPETVRAADAVDRAVADTLSDPTCRTGDLGGRFTTRDMGDAVCARVHAHIAPAGARVA